jgi:hypothetical protein
MDATNSKIKTTMKSKIAILVGATALVTLSFTLVSVHSADKTETRPESSAPAPVKDSEPAGGFVIEDRF